MKALKHFALIIAAIALLCASCEPETEDPSGASATLPQITLVNNSPSTAFLLIFNNSNRIADTDKLAPNTSAQAKFMKTNINSAGEQARIEVWKREDSTSDTKLYEDRLTLYPRDRYTYTVDKDYNVRRRY